MLIVSKKLCLLGEVAVGKTSLVRRYVERQFSDRYFSTSGVKISRKTLNWKNLHYSQQNSLQLIIWDIEGQIKFNALTPRPSYLQGASAAIVVADVTRHSTIEQLRQYIGFFLSIDPQGKIAIALNKADLLGEEKVEKFIENIKLKQNPKIIGIYSTSAKTGANVDEIFEKVAEQLMISDQKCCLVRKP